MEVPLVGVIIIIVISGPPSINDGNMLEGVNVSLQQAGQEERVQSEQKYVW